MLQNFFCFTNAPKNKLVFVPGKLFQPSLICVIFVKTKAIVKHKHSSLLVRSIYYNDFYGRNYYRTEVR
jgi:hypothetical protein